MGESILSGVEFKDSGLKEKNLTAILEDLRGRQVRMVMKNDEISVLVDVEFKLEDIVRRENRIETGHLTLDDTYFELVNDTNVKIYFPLVQFQKVEHYGATLLFRFDSYWWMLTMQ